MHVATPQRTALVWPMKLVSVWMITLIIGISFGQEAPVPESIQYPLLCKVLTFDRNLVSRVGDRLVVGVLFQSKYRASYNIKESFRQTVQESSYDHLKGIPISIVFIDLDENGDWQHDIDTYGIDLLYVAPLRAVDIKEITDFSHTKKILTMSGIPEYVEKGIALGIGLTDERPQILINLPAAKAAGADFSSQILGIAKVFR